MTTYTQLKADAVDARIRGEKALAAFRKAKSKIGQQELWEWVCECDRDLDCCEAQLEKMELERNMARIE